MNSLFSLVSGSDAVDLGVLEAAAFDGDVLIDCLTDEELFWLRQGETSHDAAMDEPYLSTLAEDARRVATDSGLRSLIAKGMVDVDPDEPTHLDFVGAYRVLAELRSDADVVTRLRLDVPGEEPIRYSYSRISDSLILTEEVADGGFHDFTLQSPSAAAVALASIFDRNGTAGPTSGPSSRAARREQLSPNPDQLAADALHVVLVRSSARVDQFERSLSVYATIGGVHLVWMDGGNPPHIAVRLNRTELESVAFDLILGDAPSV